MYPPHPGTTYLVSYPPSKKDNRGQSKDSEIKFMVSIKWVVEDIYFYVFIRFISKPA